MHADTPAVPTWDTLASLAAQEAWVKLSGLWTYTMRWDTTRNRVNVR